MVVSSLASLALGEFCLAIEPSTQLWLRGCSVIPTPRKVEMKEGSVALGPDWAWRAGEGVDESSIAVRTLLEGIRLQKGETGPAVHLAVRPGAVVTGGEPEIDGQAYRLIVAPDSVEITGNSEQGLFYGVQTVLQMVQSGWEGQSRLPLCSIEDWPSYRLRFIHWDTKNHQDRLETLKGYLDWCARFKVNMISFEIWDKFEFPSHPYIGVPGAFTSAQLQELVDYGLERFIQIVPNIQAPAHYQWALKHPQLAHLRADGSDYQACMCDEETYKLTFALYDDVINATKGVDYLHVSTDEVYYAGICKKCNRPYTPENRSLVFVDFVNRAHEYLAGKARKVIIWAEWPLMPEHVSMLAPDIIDGVLGNDYFVGRIPFVTRRAYIEEENKRGIRQLAYTSQTSRLAPVIFNSNWLDLRRIYDMITYEAKEGNPIGVFGAGWDDSGPHSEVYWLGWSAVAQYGWTPGTPSLGQHVEEFTDVYYGPKVSGIREIYEGLEEQVELYQRTWDSVITSVPGKGDNRGSYGNSEGKYAYPRPPRTATLPQPALPFSPGLDIVPVYTGRYEQMAGDAEKLLAENYRLKQKIQEELFNARSNKYNLEVMLSLAEFTRHHEELLMGLKAIEENLQEARQAAGYGRANDAVTSLMAVYSKAADIVRDRKETLQYFKTVWSKSRRPDYLTRPEYFEREESLHLEEWMQRMATIIQEYARANSVPIDGIQKELEAQNRRAGIDR